MCAYCPTRFKPMKVFKINFKCEKRTSFFILNKINLFTFIYIFKNRNKGYIIGGTRTLPIYQKL
jgi:hypothetical protein